MAVINRRIQASGVVSSSSDARGPSGGVMPLNRGSAKGWSPTVANLLVLLVIEMVAFSVIRYVFRRVT